MKIIDAHSHIDYITCDFQPSVVGVICCSTEKSDWYKIVDLMKQKDCIYGAFGIHPWFIEFVKNDFLNHLEMLLKSNKKYMIGEIGLDKYKPNMEKQIDIFFKQFDIAINLKRTIFLHCVGAWDKILYILKQYKQSELPIIVAHDFNASADITDNLLKYKNIMFSFSKNSVYGKNSRISQIPPNRILVESDGKPNVILKDIITEIGNIKKDINMPDIIYNNTKQVLNNE